MQLIPAIDLLGGKAVRLHKGSYDDVTVYDDDPVGVALRFQASGAERVHLVDLEGARAGRAVHVEIIERIVKDAELEVQVGGGIRDRDTALRWLDAGAAGVVMGTAALENPEMVARLAEEWPKGVIVAVDARGGRIATQGWLKETDVALDTLAQDADAWGAAALLYTDIERDGTGVGPNVAATARLQSTVRARVIASGGIGTLQHLRDLKGAGVRAAVCGRALYGGAIDLAEAFKACAEP